MQTTISLLSTQHIFDSVVKTIILTELSDRVGAAFLGVHAKHDPEMLAIKSK